MDYSNKHITPEILRQINAEAALMNQEYSINSPGHLKDEIFDLLEKVGTLIFYPFEEENLWGIYVSKNEKNYFIINSSITLEEQIFAGAHELAHSLDMAKVNFEIVTADLMTEYVNHKDFGEELEKADAIANRFAAELLVGKKQLQEKFDELPESYDYLTKAVLLSDIFLVPYRTIVKRFIEIEIVKDHNNIKKLLEVEKETIKLICERYECCSRNWEVSNQKKLGGYVHKAIMLYEEELSTFKELESRLELLKKVPEDYEIFDDSLNIHDFLRYASDNPELEEDYDEED